MLQVGKEADTGLDLPHLRRWRGENGKLGTFNVIAITLKD